ncbi:hypothetical protein KKA14_09065, partial [bacterium]|nr:hypothetical protein [bacterium]
SKYAKRIGSLLTSDLHYDLEVLVARKVDIINLRQVNTVLQMEVISDDRCIFHKNSYDVDEFEMLTLSKYQKLNEERQEIIADAIQTGSFIQL